MNRYGVAVLAAVASLIYTTGCATTTGPGPESTALKIGSADAIVHINGLS